MRKGREAIGVRREVLNNRTMVVDSSTLLTTGFGSFGVAPSLPRVYRREMLWIEDHCSLALWERDRVRVMHE